MVNISSETPSEMEARIGENTQTLRLRRNIDQETLAERTDVSRSALINLDGENSSTLRPLTSVLRALKRGSWLNTLAPVASIDPMTMSRDKSVRRQVSAAPNRRDRLAPP